MTGALESHSNARVREVSRLIFGEDEGGNIIAFPLSSLGGIYQKAKWDPKGQERLTLSGAHAHATIPSGATMAIVTAEDGKIRYLFDGDATSSSAGFIPENGIKPLFFKSTTTLTFYGAATTYANIDYYG